MTSTPKLILIADDDENDALLLRRLLKKAGVANPVITVSDGTEVLTYLRGEGKFKRRNKFPPAQVLLLDLKMPWMDGFQVMQWVAVHKQFAGMLIIVLGGHGELESIREAYRLGARSFLTKPCELDDVQNLIKGYPAYWNFKQRKASRRRKTRKSAQSKV